MISKLCISADMPQATINGTRVLRERSKSSNSNASIIAASGVPKIPAIPAAAPVASRIRLSEVETGKSWPSNDPIAAPVTMIGPSAPKGPPVPIAMAAETGLAIAERGLIRLLCCRIASMDSGIPCPLIIGANLAMADTAAPPASAVGINVQFGW